MLCLVELVYYRPHYINSWNWFSPVDNGKLILLILNPRFRHNHDVMTLDMICIGKLTWSTLTSKTFLPPETQCPQCQQGPHQPSLCTGISSWVSIFSFTTLQLTHAPSPQDCHARKGFLSLKGFRQYSSQHVLGVPEKFEYWGAKIVHILGIPACISSLLDPVQTLSPCSHRTSYRTGTSRDVGALSCVKIVVLSYEYWVWVWVLSYEH